MSTSSRCVGDDAPSLTPANLARLSQMLYDNAAFPDEIKLQGKEWKLIHGPPGGEHTDGCLRAVILGPTWWPHGDQPNADAAVAAAKLSRCRPTRIQLVVCYRGTDPTLAGALLNNSQLMRASLFTSQGTVKALEEGAVQSVASSAHLL